MYKPSSPKERNLIKGAIRRVFSRSELRRKVVNDSIIAYHDETRPRVKKWSECPICKSPTPTYQMEVDHISPIINVNESLEDLSWDDLVTRLWCDEKNLMAVCKACHKEKSKAENKLRRTYNKGRKHRSESV